MIKLKTATQLKKMRDAGRISQLALLEGGKHVEPGITTGELDRIMHDFIVKAGAKPSFLGYGGFPATACISVNDEVIHGIPDKHRRVENGDIVSIDVGAIYNGWQGDNAWTFAAGTISPEAQALLDTTQKSLFEGIKMATAGNRLGDVGHAVQACAESQGYSVVRNYVGHGIGQEMHEEPDVPNYGHPGHGVRLVPGMVIAIEPMINQGKAAVRTMANGWTVKTADGGLAAHFEHTIAITEKGPVILTQP